MIELYNKDIKVAEIDTCGYGLVVVEPDLLPFTLRGQKTASHFLQNRLHDVDRIYGAAIERLLGVGSIDKIIDKTALVSLNDTFWLKKSHANRLWSDVNLYDEENVFNEHFFKAALFGLSEEEHAAYANSDKPFHVVTPEFTTGGSYAKAWYRDKDYGLCLLKRGRKRHNNREVVSEYLASKIAKQICSDAAKYHLIENEDGVYCASEIFTNEDCSFISFADYISSINHYQNATESTIDYVKSVVSEFDDDNKVNKMLISDVLIFNKDRHFGNLGFLYNPNNMKITGFAPAFDFNQSLGFDVSDFIVKEISGYKPDISFKIGRNAKDVVKACSTVDILDKVESCNFESLPQVTFEFWTGERNEMVRQMFEYQKERVLTQGKYYALSRNMSANEVDQSGGCDIVLG